jgi:hypothetical protein
MERITKTNMYSMIDTLNQIKPMEGAKFGLDWAYGGVRLVKRYNATGGESDLTARGTTREIYNIMCGIEAFYRA